MVDAGRRFLHVRGQAPRGRVRGNPGKRGLERHRRQGVFRFREHLPGEAGLRQTFRPVRIHSVACHPPGNDTLPIFLLERGQHVSGVGSQASVAQLFDQQGVFGAQTGGAELPR